MTLKYETDTIDDIPEAHRAFYVDNGEGGYVLAVDGAAGLTSALKKERDLAKSLQRELRSFGETADDRAEKFAKLGGFESVLEQHRAASALEKAALAAEIEAMRTHEHETISDTLLRTALERANVTDQGADILHKLLAKRFTIETVDGKRRVTILDAEGKPMMNAEGKPATFADLTAEAMNTWPSQFQGSGAGGGGTPTKQIKPTSKVITRSEWDGMSPHARADRMRNGFKIVD